MVENRPFFGGAAAQAAVPLILFQQNSALFFYGQKACLTCRRRAPCYDKL